MPVNSFKGKYEIVVIGAGQSGLALGYFLKKKGRDFVLLDLGKKAGESWRQRYDSLKLFTQRRFSSLPGLSISGNPRGYPTGREVADYLEEYVTNYSLPVRWGFEVSSLTKKDKRFLIEGSLGSIEAQAVIIATGIFQVPFFPDYQVSNKIFQLHSFKYANSSRIGNGEVLIVGSGNSAAQIACELGETGRKIFLSANRRLKFISPSLVTIICFFSRFSIFEKLIKFLASLDLFKGKGTMVIIGKDLLKLLKNGKVILKPRISSTKGELVLFDDESSISPKTIIWATGYKKNYSWVKIPLALDEQGLPRTHDGISVIENLYFLNLSKRSEFIGYVGREAKKLIDKVLKGTS